MPRFLLVQNTPGAPPQKLRLTGEILIGREVDCAVVLNDDLVSRHHARVTLQGNVVALKDLNSTNGTTLEGARLTKEMVLRPGQSFGVGQVIMAEDQAGPARQFCQHILQRRVVAGIADKPDVSQSG